MTLRTNARIVGFTLVLYIVAGIRQVLSSRGPANDLLTTVTAFSALVGVAPARRQAA